MKYAKVSADGTYTPPPPSNSKASYSTMVYVRSTIVEETGWHLAKAATIAVSIPPFHAAEKCCSLFLHSHKASLPGSEQLLAKGL